jgi:ribonuclease P protein component
MLTLKGKREFQKVFECGKWITPRGSHLRIRALRTVGFRFGFVAPKKIGCAVVRNRLRRQFREILRLGMETHNWNGHFVVFLTKELIDYDFQEKRRMLLDLLAPFAGSSV